MSKMVSDRARAARRVAQSATTHAETVGARLDAEFAAAAVDGAPPGAALLGSLGALITARAAAMEAADRAHETELADDILPRADRDGAFEALLSTFADLRDVVGVVGGSTLVKRMGLAGAAPRTPDALIQAGKMALQRLRTLGLPDKPGLQTDAAALAEQLERRIVALGDALIAVDREAREAEATLQAKHQAIAAYDQAFSGAAAALSALFVLADEAELARRVRPSTRRPGRTIEDPAVGGDDPGDAVDDAPEAEPDGLPLRPLPGNDG